jgi:hypothetical protein
MKRRSTRVLLLFDDVLRYSAFGVFNVSKDPRRRRACYDASRVEALVDTVGTISALASDSFLEPRSDEVLFIWLFDI